MKHYLFRREIFFATLGVFFFLFILKKLLPINLHIFDPINAATTDVRFNDLAFSKFKNPNIDSNIVIVRLTETERSKIADLLKIMPEYHPKVTGLDLVFLERKADTMTDRYLASTIENYPDLVMAEKLIMEDEKINTQNIFSSVSKNKGYANFILEKNGVVRHYSPFEKKDAQTIPCFSSAILKIADQKAYEKLLKRGRDFESINYSLRPENFNIIGSDEILQKKIPAESLRDKIVLIGFVNTDVNNIEDKFFTPFNEKFVGRSLPDMNGVLVHANILSMCLKEEYIDPLPIWLMLLLSFLIAQLHMAYFTHLYKNAHLWFHIKLKMSQLLSSILLIYAGIYLLLYFNMYIDFTFLIAAVLLSVDILYIYEALMIWLNKRFRVKTMFIH